MDKKVMRRIGRKILASVLFISGGFCWTVAVFIPAIVGFLTFDNITINKTPMLIWFGIGLLFFVLGVALPKVLFQPKGTKGNRKKKGAISPGEFLLANAIKKTTRDVSLLSR